MKTRFFFAALLLLAFGSVKAQDTVTTTPRHSDPVRMMPDMSQLPELMRELGVNLQHLSDSVDWRSFEEDMERWGAEMEEWGRKMERWGEGFEQKFEYPYDYESLNNDDLPVRSIVIGGSGDVRIKQSQDGFFLFRGDKATRRQPYMANGTLILGGPSDYEVAIPQLNEIIMSSSGDVIGRGMIKGDNLNLVVSGSGDLKLDVDYDTIRVLMSGSGDVMLMGQCKMIYADIHGSGDLKIQQLIAGESHINATGSGEAKVNKVGNVTTYHQRKTSPPTHKSLLFDAHWNGFEAGLNMLIDPTMTYVYSNPNGTTGLEIRPLRSWYFGFNIADVGIAFNRRHTAGLFTGVGIGWNNFSWNNNVKVGYDPETDGYSVVPIESDEVVKNSKYGALFLQAPLMFEVRPTRHMYIDAGVTGGLRIAQWNRVKYENGNSDKQFYGGIGSGVRLFKLDASFRVGGENIGFFANYALLPIFEMSNAKVHPINFGFSINF
ncbi:MAG: DUF2807 domain-containing protein [Bacteroidales bacterium]|nr:DUF2807 domain-containing protein [Bacteroidales bacterium]